MERSIDYYSTGKQIAARFGTGRALSFWMARLRAPRALHDWLDFLQHDIEEPARLGLAVRVLRPYMRQDFTLDQRRALISNHYRTMAQHFHPHDALRAEPGIVMATLTGKGGATYTLHLGGSTTKEGELAFSMLDAAGNSLARLIGTIGPDETGAPVLWIGGLQGAKPPIGRDAIVFATRDLSGLRPKGAVLLAAQTFCRALGLTALRGPGNEGHISQRGFRRLRRKRKIHADYAQFWEEIGGVQTQPGEYTLPVEPPVRDIEQVKRHKRSEWKKRQSITEALVVSVLATLKGMNRGN